MATFLNLLYDEFSEFGSRTLTHDKTARKTCSLRPFLPNERIWTFRISVLVFLTGWVWSQVLDKMGENVLWRRMSFRRGEFHVVEGNSSCRGGELFMSSRGILHVVEAYFMSSRHISCRRGIFHVVGAYIMSSSRS